MFTFSNTHLLVQEFEYVEAKSVNETTALLARNGDRVKLLAGGTDLLVQMKIERQNPLVLVNIGKIAGLKKITQNGGVNIGATATIRAVETNPRVRELYTALAEACRSFSTIQVMVMGTLGGNICNASPAADTAPALLVFDAEVTLVSQSGERRLPLEKFFLGPGKLALRADQMLSSIRLPNPVPNTGSAFLKIARVEADIAKVCAAVRIVREGDTVRDCRIALGSVAPIPMRARQAEASLLGLKFTPDLADEAAVLASEEIKPITDVRSTREYRQQVARVLVRDALNLAVARASRGLA